MNSPHHNARKAAARRLQRAHPGLKYTDAHAACSPDAALWRTFSKSLHTADLFYCTNHCLEATHLLVKAADDRTDADQTTIATAATWAIQVASRLAEIHTHAGTVEVSIPFAAPSLPPMPPAPPLNQLASTDGLDKAAAELTYADRIASALTASTTVPPEVHAVATQIANLRRWISTPGAG